MAVQFASIKVNSASLFAPGGDVTRWCQYRAKELELLAKANAPPSRSESRWGHVGSGDLQRGIHCRAFIMTSREVGITLWSEADHTMFVHDGTGRGGRAYIYSTAGWQMKATIDRWYRTKSIPYGKTFKDSGLQMWTPFGPRLRVKGQQRRPFLTDAYAEVRRAHSAFPAIRLQRPS